MRFDIAFGQRIGRVDSVITLLVVEPREFNGENEGITFDLDDSFDDTNRCFVRRFQEAEIGEALKRMKGGKAMVPDGIPIEVWRCLGDRAIVWLTKLFNFIFRSNKMLEE